MRSAGRGRPGATTKITASDTAQSLSDAGVLVTSSNNRSAIGMLITVDKPGGSGYDIRVAWGGTTPEATVGTIIEAGDSIYVEGSGYLATFKFINRSAGNNAIFHVTVEFEPAAVI